MTSGTVAAAARVRGLTRDFDGRRVLDGLDRYADTAFNVTAGASS